MYTNLYNPNRQYLFIQRQATLFVNRWLIAAAAIFGSLLLITLATAYLNPDKFESVRGTYYFGFYLVGLIFTSQIFRELNRPNQAYSFLTLPVSTLEKLIGSWLLSSPIFILVYSLICYVIYLLGNLIVGTPTASINFFSGPYWDSVGSYMIIQTIFLWGACYFRKNNFLKTLLTTVVFGIAVGLYIALLLWLFYGGTSMSINASEVNPGRLGEIAEGVTSVLTLLLAPYMLLVSYFTLKERQL